MRNSILISAKKHCPAMRSVSRERSWVAVASFWRHFGSFFKRFYSFVIAMNLHKSLH
jgi:hypothetical protein